MGCPGPMLFVFSLAGLAAVVSSRSVDPIILPIARDLAIPVATAALLATAYSLPFALGQPVLGPLGDLYGKARMMKSCLWLLAASLAACAAAPAAEPLFAARLVAGIAAGGVIPSAMAMIGDRIPVERRQLAISRFVMVGLLGQIFSAGAAGAIAVALGWRSVFAIAAAVALAAAVAATFALRDAAPPARGSSGLSDALGKYAAVFANPKALLCYGTVFLEGATLFGVLPYVADIFERGGLGGPREAGFAIAGIGAGGLLYTLVLPALLRRAGRIALMACGGAVATAGLWGLAAGLPWPATAALFAVTGFGYMMLHNSIQTEVVGLAPAARASAYAMHAFSFFSGQAVGPVLFGLGLQTVGVGAAVAVAAGILTLTGFAVARRFAKLPAEDRGRP